MTPVSLDHPPTTARARHAAALVATACFRQEAGGGGRQSGGLIRLNEFWKLELVHITTATGSDSALEELLADAVRPLALLGLPHRVVPLPVGALPKTARRAYDIECWLERRGGWLEVGTVSDCGDFQARRVGLKVRAPKGRPVFAHTLNGTGLALPRVLAVLLEACYDASTDCLHWPEPLSVHLKADSWALR